MEAASVNRDLGYCETTYNTYLSPADARQCSKKAKQQCANCDTKLCDLHAEFCVEHNRFYCEGCWDIHREMCHTETIAELVERIVPTQAQQ